MGKRIKSEMRDFLEGKSMSLDVDDAVLEGITTTPKKTTEVLNINKDVEKFEKGGKR